MTCAMTRPMTGTMTGSELRAWRRAARLTQDAASARLGVSRRALQKYEARGDQPIPKLLALAVGGAARPARWRNDELTFNP